MPSIGVIQLSTMVQNGTKQNIRLVRSRQVCRNRSRDASCMWWLLLCSRKPPEFFKELVNLLSSSFFNSAVFILFLIQELTVAEIRQEPFLLSPCLVSVSGLTCNTTGKHVFVAFPIEIRPGSSILVTATCQSLVCFQPTELPPDC